MSIAVEIKPDYAIPISLIYYIIHPDPNSYAVFFVFFPPFDIHLQQTSHVDLQLEGLFFFLHLANLVL